MMELYTDKGNFHSLKILIASNVTQTPLTLKVVGGEERVVPFLDSRVLPVLLTESRQYIFSANAATRYLFRRHQPANNEDICDLWLEWEVSQFKPLLHRLILAKASKSKNESSLFDEVKTLVKAVEAPVSKSTSNCLSKTTEIVLWSALYPLFFVNSPFSGLRKDFPSITAWFDKQCTEQTFTDAVSKIMDQEVWTGIKTSVSSQPLPPSVESCRTQLNDLKVSNTPSTTDSEGTPVVEAVTAEEIALATDAWEEGLSRAELPRPIVHPILPEEGKQNMLITSALPYVNNVPHLGNIVGCVLSADAFARFCRLRNLPTLYICGTDEYGTATETKAVEEGLTPQEICDKYNALHKQIYDWFNIGFDYFGRTTTPQQTECAQDIFWKLNKRGFISTDSVDQLQCVKCVRFLADRFVEGTCPFCAYEDARGDQCDKCGKLINAIELLQPRCKLCKSTPIVKTSQHLFLDLPKLEPLLVEHLDRNFEKGVWSFNTKVITKAWIRDGLRARCITRDLKWGTPVPLEGFTDKVFYVWYDAPIGYISITANYMKDWEIWWKNPQQVDLYQFMAKDNVPFHSVIFPSCQLGTGEPFTVVNHLSATEYLNYEDGKFSKSRGVGVFGNDAKETGIPAHVWRFYLLYIRPESQDSAFSWDDFLLKNNSELLNNLGNFINRALMFISNNFGGVMPAMTLTDGDRELLALVTRELKSYISNLEKIKLRDGIRNILSISRLGNQYMQANKPWVLVKGNPEEKGRAGTVVGLAANISCLLSVLVQPYMPTVSDTIQQQLKAPAHCNVISGELCCYLQPGHTIGKPQPLFQKIDPQLIQELKKRFAGSQADRKVSKQGASGSNPAEVQRLTDEVASQGNKVRELKGKKAEKSVIDAEVAKLLSLKKQLSSAQSGGASATTGTTKPVDPAEVVRLTQEVTDQGNKVRELKGKKAEKSVIDAEVAKLLNLKKQLSSAESGGASATTGTTKPVDPAEVVRLTKEVTHQGNKVRELKGKKAEKSVIDAEVAKLLSLKKELGSLQVSTSQPESGGKKKKSKK